MSTNELQCTGSPHSQLQDLPSNGTYHWLDSDIPTYDWFLFKTPWPVTIITGVYLIFTLKIGPALMKNREPFDLKCIMMIYNLYQFISNGYMVFMLLLPAGSVAHMVNNYCHPIDVLSNTFLEHEYTFLWLFLISKITDLLDTVFFILRNKKSHLTFLHIYHHANMVLATWFLIRKFSADLEKLLFLAFNNAFVHTVMYFYYFMASLGPRFQKYLWWKVYVTRVQITQLILDLFFIGHVIYMKCTVDKMFAWVAIIETCVFLILFVNFYIRAYLLAAKKNKKDPVSVDTVSQNTKMKLN